MEWYVGHCLICKFFINTYVVTRSTCFTNGLSHIDYDIRWWEVTRKVFIHFDMCRCGLKL